MAASFISAEALRGPCACVEVATGEIAGGVVMKPGCPALEEWAAVRKHAKIKDPTTESSLRRRKACTWRLTLGSVAGFMAVIVIFIRLFAFSDLNEVRLLVAQLLCQQTRLSLIAGSTVFYGIVSATW